MAERGIAASIIALLSQGCDGTVILQAAAACCVQKWKLKKAPLHAMSSGLRELHDDIFVVAADGIACQDLLGMRLLSYSQQIKLVQHGHCSVCCNAILQYHQGRIWPSILHELASW